jgi:hypothetical protein
LKGVKVLFICKLACGAVEDGHYNVAWNMAAIGKTEYCLECCKHSKVIEVYHKPESDLLPV